MREHWDPETKQWMPVDDEPVRDSQARVDTQQPSVRTFWDRHPLVWLLVVVLAVLLAVPVALFLFVVLSPLLFLWFMVWMVGGSLSGWSPEPINVRVVGPQ